MKKHGTLSLCALAALLPLRGAFASDGEASPPRGLVWNLPQYATLEGDVLTVDVPPEAARRGCRAWAEIDLSAYDGVPFEAEIEASGERIGKPRDAWNGLKFQFEYRDPDSGETFYPNTESRLGDFPHQTLRVRDDLCTAKAAPARLVLGLQDTSGKVVFDLSTLRIASGRPYWPVTNQTHRCEYRAPMAPPPPGASATASPPSASASRAAVAETAIHSGAITPRRGVLAPARDMTADDFATLREWGATLLRYQMIRQWHEKNANRDLGEFDRWLAGRLDHFETFVLPMCRESGIKVVLDLHVTPGGRRAGGEYNMLFEREYAEHFVELWRRIAERFRGNADVIYGYDLCNEPVQMHEALPDCDYWSLQRRAAAAIREIDPETPVVVESNLWDVPSTFGTLSPLALANVVYEVHVYNPIEYTHQGLDNRSRDVFRYPDPERGWDKEKLRSVLAPVRAFEKRHGAKIYVGEFSAIAWAPGAEDYLRDSISLFEEFGWDWTYHAFREWEGWSVEHEALHPADSSGKNFRSAADTPRRKALLEALKAGPATP